MKRIIIRQINTNAILQTIFCEDNSLDEMCTQISINSEYGGIYIDYDLEIDTLTQTQIYAIQYLKDTDWMVIRKADTGEKIPDVVTTARQTARKLL
jgi:hypothetical protein